METKESATEKIKALRIGVAKDKASKIDGGRKSGEADPKESESASSRAEGEKRLRWGPPEEFEAVDFTAAEQDMRQKLQGPDLMWAHETADRARFNVSSAPGDSAPITAKALVSTAQRLVDGPVLSQLRGASDDLYAWAATRVALDEKQGLQELLGELATYGLGEIADEAAGLLDSLNLKAGSSGKIWVGEPTWTTEGRGTGEVKILDEVWKFHDYREEVTLTEELAGILQQVGEGVERRQCVTKAIAAGSELRKRARLPTMEEVDLKAREMRLEQARLALEAKQLMGDPKDRLAPVEAEIRVYLHDILTAHHDKDFRASAVFPWEALDDCKLVVIRADYRGELIVESVTGPSWSNGGWVMWTLIWRGHMVLLQPPNETEVEQLLERLNPFDTPALGFHFFWQARYDQQCTAPGHPPCRLCRPVRKAGEHMVESIMRKTSVLAAVAACPSGPTANLKAGGTNRSLELQEVFAGVGKLTAAWLRHGGKAEEPIEVYADPHRKQGYRREHDVTKDDVFSRLRSSAKASKGKCWWIASPCTSFCDWGLMNHGTRSFERPQGGTNGIPLKESEMLGNMLADRSADLFVDVLEAGGLPIAESTAVSTRYPKMWHLPKWQAILKRADVEWVEFPMCAFGLGPPDAPRRLLPSPNEGCLQAMP